MAIVTRCANVPPAAAPLWSMGSRLRRFQSTGVRSSLSNALPSVTPSASSPTSWSRKSLYGRMTLLRSAASSVAELSVCHSGTWHFAHPVSMNTVSPDMPDFGVWGGTDR